MSSKENKNNLKKEIQISSEKIPKKENVNNNKSNKETQRIEIEEEIYQNEDEIILKKEKEYEELNNINNYDYSNEIYIIENKNKKYNNKRKQQPIYTKIRTESCRNPKNKINNCIYKSGKGFQNKNKMTSNINNYIMNTAKYSIKNPIKEKSKNKYKKNKINETDINNNNSNYNYDNYNINTNEISNFENYGYKNYNINKTNYLYARNDELNDSDNSNKINIITKTKNQKNNNKINLQKQPKKNSYMSFNSFNRLQDANHKYVPNTTKGEGRITYICDYSQENNKDSYYIESPNEYNRHISIYPIEAKLKKRKNKEKKYIKGDKLKKEIEDSKRKFEKIREIEREIKNYFNLNGLDIVNRELYDQSATMIQATFRAYLLRIKLYEKLNMYINIKSAIDILKEIFIPRKINHWEYFLNAMLEYINNINNKTNNNIEDENQVNLNSEKYQYLNEEFNEIENNKIKYVKKIPTSYKYKQKPKNKIMNSNSLIAQSCISFNFNNINNKEDQLNGNMKTSGEKNNNIIKDTQESMELKLNDELKNIADNNDNKLYKLKYILKLIELKFKQIQYKYFMKLLFNSLILKQIKDINDKNKKEKNKALKRLILNKERSLKYLKNKMFRTFYFKSLINEKKHDDNISIDEQNEKDKNNQIINEEQNKTKINDKEEK